MPESVRRTKKSVPYFHMTRETVADRQNRPVNGLFCFSKQRFRQVSGDRQSLRQQKSFDDPIQHSRVFNVFLSRQDQISMLPKSHAMIDFYFSFVLFVIYRIT